MLSGRRPGKVATVEASTAKQLPKSIQPHLAAEYPPLLGFDVKLDSWTPALDRQLHDYPKEPLKSILARRSLLSREARPFHDQSLRLTCLTPTDLIGSSVEANSVGGSVFSAVCGIIVIPSAGLGINGRAHSWQWREGSEMVTGYHLAMEADRKLSADISPSGSETRQRIG